MPNDPSYFLPLVAWYMFPASSNIYEAYGVFPIYPSPGAATCAVLYLYNSLTFSSVPWLKIFDMQ